MECIYKYPPPATKVLKTLWFRYGLDNALESLESFREYVGRARHRCSGQRCTLSISDVTEEDARRFKFRFITDVAIGKYTVPPGVTLTVTAGAYVWYENGVKVGSETDIRYSGNFKSSFSYSCAVKGNEKHPSPAVCVDDTHCNQVTYRGSRRVCAPFQYKFTTSELDWRSTLHGVSLTVTDNPSGPSVVVSPPGVVIEGRPANLTCSFDSNRGFNYTWEKRPSQWELVAKDLVFSPARSSDSGWYSCSVDSEFGRRTSATVFIDVEYAPRPPSVWVTSDEVREGASVELNCSSDANPEANYTWYKEGDTVASGKSFTIAGVRREQAGSYLCRAQNLRGHSEAAVRLSVVSESNTGWFEGPLKIPYVSITGLLLLLLSLAVFLLLRFKPFREHPEPARRAEYHVKRMSTRQGGDPEVEEDDHDYVSIGSCEDPIDSPGLQGEVEEERVVCVTQRLTEK
ncbi:sialic acid-binding Ig-like lectin 12 [Synchiropus splendidus]|uniref:sialic acid-binding Ig-like lectin 12 n=1 Tax=Synchiropus splendidus TaxID=270530 RepID=UPI00237D777F|nr:sialic acid-binding Ig-like lectin 12 [Synchiropus splendidus]